MPRDCTARRVLPVYEDVQSLCGGGIQYTPLSNCRLIFTFTALPSFYAMAKKSQKNNNNNRRGKQNAVVRAPTSIGVRKTTQAGGQRQEVMLDEVNIPADNFILHCGSIPWLKGVARSYQTWNLKDVRIWFEPRVSTATNGTMQLAFLRDFQDPIPTTVAQISQLSGASRAAVWDKQSIRIPQGKAMEYCSLSNFQSMDSSDKMIAPLGEFVG